MARHRDNSLKYYNRDVYDDDNLKFIQATNGLIGWAVVEKLRQKIYASLEAILCLECRYRASLLQ
jgi:hypothetical protein